MKNKGALPHAYTANLGQPDESDYDEIPRKAMGYGAVQARLIDCRTQLAHEGIAALQCGAFHISTAGVTLLQHHAAGPCRHRHHAGRGDEGGRRQHLGRRFTTYIRQRHRALLPLRPADQPGTEDLQAPGSTRPSSTKLGGRKEMSEFLIANGYDYKMSVEKAYSTDSNMLGATHEAKDLEHLNSGIRIVNPIMGVAFWKDEVQVKAEGSHRALRGRHAGRAQRPDLRQSGRADPGSQPHRRPSRPGHERPDRNRIIEAKSRGIYEGPGLALLHIAYERLVTASTTRTPSSSTASTACAWAAFCTRAAGSTRRPSCCARPRSAGSRAPSPARSSLELRRGNDYSILDTASPNLTYRARAPVDGKVEDAPFTPLDRIGQLTMRNLDITDTRAKLGIYSDAGLLSLGQGDFLKLGGSKPVPCIHKGRATGLCAFQALSA